MAEAAYQAADPAHWLALETAGRALADAGFPGGQGLAGDRAGVLLGNTLSGEVSRAAALRTQWPFVATVLEAALAAEAVPPAGRPGVLRHAADAFAAPFPEPGPATLAGSQPGAIADRICRHFGFRGGGQAVDAAHSSALLAVATGCALLAAGELDFVLAGGVDVSLDPFELDALAQAGLLTAGPMRIYDASPTGFLPGEGCGIIALMRAADARAADMPSYADIVGWGMSSAGLPSNQLLALQRAYQRAAVQPADVQFIEGDGRGTADADLAELTALTTIRAGAAAAAALGSVKANIGHTKAAAGAAGLIKAALAVNAGVIPPVTGCVHPHPLLSDAWRGAPGAPVGRILARPDQAGRGHLDRPGGQHRAPGAAPGTPSAPQARPSRPAPPRHPSPAGQPRPPVQMGSVQMGGARLAAVGQGVGEITALVWAGSLAEAAAVRLIAERAAVLTASSSRADRSAALREVLAGAEFTAPAKRLISAVTGREVTPDADIRGLLCDQITEPVRLAEALRTVAAGVDLLLDTGPGQAMAGLAAGCGPVPVVSLAAGPDSPAAPAVAAALFAAGAVTSLGPLLAGRPSRQIDIVGHGCSSATRVPR